MTSASSTSMMDETIRPTSSPPVVNTITDSVSRPFPRRDVGHFLKGQQSERPTVILHVATSAAALDGVSGEPLDT